MQDLTPGTPLVGAAIRSEFPIFEHTTYLNSCSQGALSYRVRQAYEDYLNGWDERGAEWEHWVERAEAARGAFARLLHAEPTELAVTTSVSQGVNGIVSALPFERGGRTRIVISEYEFPTVGQIAHAQELRGAEVVHVLPAADGSIPAERFAEAIDDQTALVCCTTMSYRTGHRQDVAEIARAAHQHGALCLADSYQAVGAIDLDVRALGVDFATGGTVKYLLGSAGLGFLYVRRDKIPALWPLMAAAKEQDANIRKYEEIGTHPAGNHNAIGVALAFHRGIGVERKSARLKWLRDRWAVRVTKENSRIHVLTPLEGDRAGAIALVNIDGVDTPKLQQWLWGKHGIITVAIVHPEFHGLRVTPNVYTSPDEIDRFAEKMLQAARSGIA